jgi:antitoxin HigA-1
MEMRTMSKSSTTTEDNREDGVISAPAGGFRMRRHHPGRTLAQEIAARGLSAHALALRLRVPANRITEIINGRRGVTPETALRLGRHLGTGAAFWMNLQSAHDLAKAEAEIGEQVAREVDAA